MLHVQWQIGQMQNAIDESRIWPNVRDTNSYSHLQCMHHRQMSIYITLHYIRKLFIVA